MHLLLLNCLFLRGKCYPFGDSNPMLDLIPLGSLTNWTRQQVNIQPLYCQKLTLKMIGSWWTVTLNPGIAADRRFFLSFETVCHMTKLTFYKRNKAQTSDLNDLWEEKKWTYFTLCTVTKNKLSDQGRPLFWPWVGSSVVIAMPCLRFNLKNNPIMWANP